MIMDTVPMDVADMIRDVNASNEAVEDQCLRARQAADIAARSDQAAVEADTDARKLEVAHTTVQTERPRRRASLPRQVTFALGTVALDGVACYFAAQALGGDQESTLVWTGLFLAVLGGGGLVPALAGAGLFTAATAAFLALGYRALRGRDSAGMAHPPSGAQSPAGRQGRAEASRPGRRRTRQAYRRLPGTRQAGGAEDLPGRAADAP